jgi:hypothetical protein
MAVAATLMLASGVAFGDAPSARRETLQVATSAALQQKIDLALQDAARRSQLDASQLRVAMAAPVTWPDGSLGCPQPGREYTQALVAGYRIRIAAGERMLEYHASLRGTPFLCPAERVQAPAAVDPRI